MGLIPTPIECAASSGWLRPGFSKKALILTEDWVLDGWELYANPERPNVQLELSLRHGTADEFPDRLHTILRPTILHGNKAQWPTDAGKPLGIELPAGTFLGVWVVLADTDYFLLNLLRRNASRTQIVQFQPASRIPLPGEGETYGRD